MRRDTGPAKSSAVPLTHGRVYSEKEIWDNYEYFIRQVVPVAEELGIYIGIHPDDPPVPMLGGVPRCIFGNFEGYKQALRLRTAPMSASASAAAHGSRAAS